MIAPHYNILIFPNRKSVIYFHESSLCNFNTECSKYCRLYFTVYKVVTLRDIGVSCTTPLGCVTLYYTVSQKPLFSSQRDPKTAQNSQLTTAKRG